MNKNQYTIFLTRHMNTPWEARQTCDCATDAVAFFDEHRLEDEATIIRDHDQKEVTINYVRGQAKREQTMLAKGGHRISI